MTVRETKVGTLVKGKETKTPEKGDTKHQCPQPRHNSGSKPDEEETNKGSVSVKSD